MISRNWVKTSAFSWRSPSSSQSSARRWNLPLCRGRVVARADQLGRVIADLFELHELGQDEPSALDAVGLLEPLGQIAHGLFIEGGLLAAQRAEGRHLRPFRAGRR